MIHFPVGGGPQSFVPGPDREVKRPNACSQSSALTVVRVLGHRFPPLESKQTLPGSAVYTKEDNGWMGLVFHHRCTNRALLDVVTLEDWKNKRKELKARGRQIRGPKHRNRSTTCDGARFYRPMREESSRLIRLSSPLWTEETCSFCETPVNAPSKCSGTPGALRDGGALRFCTCPHSPTE